jgi:hypothetical protein
MQTIRAIFIIAGVLGCFYVIGLAVGKIATSGAEIVYPEKPRELADCRFYKLTSPVHETIVVMRCASGANAVRGKRGAVVLVDG